MFEYSIKKSIYFSLSHWHQVADANIFGCCLFCSEFFFIGTRLGNGTTQQRMLKIESSVTDFITHRALIFPRLDHVVYMLPHL